MPIFALKTYQAQALDSLRRFLTEARGDASLNSAWVAEMRAQDQPTAVRAPPYRSDPFGDVPCVCLRIPTGGGKTLLAAHAIPLMAREWRAADFPVALWLVDRHAQVKHWVRNIERQQQFSFWLPTATDHFYPDFVAELVDGRLLVVEYKGEAYATNDDSREKNAVGRAWAAASAGAALFTFVEREVGGLNMTQQLNRTLAEG